MLDKETIASKTVKIVNDKGLHARTAAIIAQFAASRPDYSITIRKDDRVAPADSILSLLTLGAGCGSCVDIEVKGSNANAVLNTMVSLIESGFTEKI